MATNQTGIAIVIKAWLPIGRSLDEQLASLQLVKDAHETGNYANLLATAEVQEVKTEQKTRRVETPVEPEAPGPLLQKMEEGHTAVIMPDPVTPEPAAEPVDNDAPQVAAFASSRPAISTGEERVDPDFEDFSA